jgi:Tfp pilus assembly protein PilO
MENYLKVEGNSDLVRDPATMAILNTSRTDYENYLRKKESLMSDKQQLANQAQEINNIKEDLSEIKQMLTALLKDRIKG